MSGPEKKLRRVHLLVSGRVQGVFFRANTQDEARRLGLTGWVRNIPSGKVEVSAQGDARAVEEFIAWCRKGPRMARVSGVEITEEEPGEAHSPFTIR